MKFDPAAALVAYHKVLDGHNITAVRHWFAENVAYTSAGLGTVQGREKVLAAIEKYFSVSPDHQAWDDKVLAISERVAVCEWHLRATNKTTGVVVERHGLETITFDDQDKIKSVVVVDHTA